MTQRTTNIRDIYLKQKHCIYSKYKQIRGVKYRIAIYRCSDIAYKVYYRYSNNTGWQIIHRTNNFNITD